MYSLWNIRDMKDWLNTAKISEVNVVKNAPSEKISTHFEIVQQGFKSQ